MPETRDYQIFILPVINTEFSLALGQFRKEKVNKSGIILVVRHERLNITKKLPRIVGDGFSYWLVLPVPKIGRNSVSWALLLILLYEWVEYVVSMLQ